jgi:nucleotide-binding universal stress UspA family protein
MTSEHVIVVGLDGSAAAWRALGWAADEAQRTGRSMSILHVVHQGVDHEPVDKRGDERALLDEAASRLAESHPSLAAATELLAGDPADLLIEMSATADLLVVGRGRRSLPHLLLGSVANRVLAHARCPTVVVADAATPAANTVVVGVSDSPGAAAALRFAFGEASLRGADLVAVRSWSMREWRMATGAALPMSSPDLWETQERTVLEDCLRPMRDAFPAVHTSTVLSSAPPEVLLERESAHAAMLVLGCRRGGGGILPRLGPLTSWAAHHFACPVVIVGVPGGHGAGHSDEDQARVPVPYLGDGT